MVDCAVLGGSFVMNGQVVDIRREREAQCERNEQPTTASQRSLGGSLTLMPPQSNGPRHGPLSSVHRSNVKVGAKFANQDMTPEEFLAYFCTEA
ncbi:hypothetical protein N7540_013189 [Penicillium herquei]|nr:hypothetical protein N7540_013189 [Penicillium herquei]